VLGGAQSNTFFTQLDLAIQEFMEEMALVEG
jgi:hypothetical protein